MNKYEVRISGQSHPIQVRASRAAIAMSRALNRLSDSNFLNTSITIRFVGRVPKVYHIQAVEIREDSRTFKRLGGNFPTKQAAEAAIVELRRLRPDCEHFSVYSTLAEVR